MSQTIRIEQRPGLVARPKVESRWPEATARAEGFDDAALEAAARIAESNQSDSLLVIRHGNLVIERYWNDKTSDDGAADVFGNQIGVFPARGPRHPKRLSQQPRPARS